MEQYKHQMELYKQSNGALQSVWNKSKSYVQQYSQMEQHRQCNNINSQMEQYSQYGTIQKVNCNNTISQMEQYSQYGKMHKVNCNNTQSQKEQ